MRSGEAALRTQSRMIYLKIEEIMVNRVACKKPLIYYKKYMHEF